MSKIFQFPWEILEIITDFLDLESYRNLCESSSECSIDYKGCLSATTHSKVKQVLEKSIRGSISMQDCNFYHMDKLERFWLGHDSYGQKEYEWILKLAMHYKHKRMTVYLLKSTGKPIKEKEFLYLLQYGDPKLVEWGISNCNEISSCMTAATKTGNLECLNLVISHHLVSPYQVQDSLMCRQIALNQTILNYAKSKSVYPNADGLIEFTGSNGLSHALSLILNDSQFVLKDLYQERSLANAIYWSQYDSFRLLIKDSRIKFKQFPIDLSITKENFPQDIILTLIEDVRVTELVSINELFTFVARHGMVDVLEYLLNIPSTSRLYDRMKKYFNLGFEANAALVKSSQMRHFNCVELILQDHRFDLTLLPPDVNLFGLHNFGLKHLQILLADDRLDPTMNDNECFINCVMDLNVRCVKELMKDSRIDPCCRDNLAIKWIASKKYSQHILDVLLQDTRMDPSLNENELLLSASIGGRLENIKLLINHERFNPNLNISKILSWTIKRKKVACLTEMLRISTISSHVCQKHIDEAIANGVDGCSSMLRQFI